MTNHIPAYVCPSVPDAKRKITFTIPAGIPFEELTLSAPLTLTNVGAIDYITADGLTGDFRIRAITDGTSNTILVGKLVARNKLYRLSKPIILTDPEAQV